MRGARELRLTGKHQDRAEDDGEQRDSTPDALSSARAALGRAGQPEIATRRTR